MNPTGNHLLVRRLMWQKLGSIHLPERLKDDHNIGGPKEYQVVAVGPGRINRKGIRIPIEAEPGDRVICYSHTAGPIPYQDDLHIITEDQILAVLPKGCEPLPQT